MTDEAKRQDEPVISYTVKGLLSELREELRNGLAEISAKLDDRVTVGVFRAMQSELDAVKRQLILVQDWMTGQQASATTRSRFSDRALAWGAVIIALLTALATILWLAVGG